MEIKKSGHDSNSFSRKISLHDLSLIVEPLFLQMQSYYSSISKIAESTSELLNIVSNISKQNISAYHTVQYNESFALKNKANAKISYPALQSATAQVMAAQENVNGAFAIAHSIQLQSHATINFHKASFSVLEQITKVVSNCIGNEDAIHKIIENSKRLHSSSESLSHSVISYYISARHSSEDMQKMIDKMYSIINNISNNINF